MDIASGQPVFLSLSFILWRKECMVTFLSVTVLRRRFINMAEHMSPPRGLAYLSKMGSSGALPLATFASAAIASIETGTERSEDLVFSRRHVVGTICKHPRSASQSCTLKPDISATRAPVSLRVM